MTINRSAVIITDNAVAASILSSCWAKPSKYVTVLESPRMDRPDAENEIARTLNVINRIRPSIVLYFGDDNRVSEEIAGSMPIPMLSFKALEELEQFKINVNEWAELTPHEAAIKLLEKHLQPSQNSQDKLIIYNGPSDVGFVIAANYAILHQASLLRLETPDELLQETIDDLNKIDASPPAVREIDVRALAEKLEAYLPDEIASSAYDKLLIITEGVPFGLAIDKQETLYANNLMLGHFLAHNIYEYEWGKRERIGLVGLFVADRSVEMPNEYDGFCVALSRAKGLPKKRTTGHPKLSELEIMTLPYDILYIATHGKQLDGVEEEYFFTDTKGVSHTLTIDRAYGVIGFVAFIKAVDGIENKSEDWGKDQQAVWGEFAMIHMYEGNPLPAPTKSRSGIKLPMRSLVLGHEPGMNSPFAVQRLASGQRPIVIANACGSWNEMSTRFTFAGASAYIGTLWAVSSKSADEFASKLHENIFDTPLDDAFFEARSSLTNNLDKKNYIMTGSFENKYDANTPFSSDGYVEVRKRLERNLAVVRERIKNFSKSTPKDIRNNTEIDEMLYKDELKALDEAEKEATDAK